MNEENFIKKLLEEKIISKLVQTKVTSVLIDKELSEDDAMKIVNLNLP
ncbi:MAG: hypothetical protein LBQ59_03420 [Candidatus Peribacteria bacterium]|nr:hypothetical protein [Candidatus Peribacteria bacterium]